MARSQGRHAAGSILSYLALARQSSSDTRHGSQVTIPGIHRATTSLEQIYIQNGCTLLKDFITLRSSVLTRGAGYLRRRAVVYKEREELAIKLLLVEDDDDIREVLTLALHLDSDIQLMSYESGEAALADVEERQLAFDVALLDYRLPGMTGIELHKALRRLPTCADMATVMITASLGKEYVALFQAENIAGLIAKPFDVLSVASEVRALTQPHRPKSTAIKWLTQRMRKAS